MATLHVQAYDEQGGGWIVADTLRPGDRAGLLSDNRPEARYTYVYGLDPDARTATVSRAPFGTDYVYGPATVAEDLQRPWNRVARLAVGEEHELTIRGDVGGREQRVRFRLEDDGG